jgi:hypothetical protein
MAPPRAAVVSDGAATGTRRGRVKTKAAEASAGKTKETGQKKTSSTNAGKAPERRVAGSQRQRSRQARRLHARCMDAPKSMVWTTA